MSKKRVVGILVAVSLILQLGLPCLNGLAEQGELIFREDYEGIAEGNRPEYGSANWTGDNGTGGYVVGVTKEDGNKALKISYTGTGGTGIASLVVYRNMAIRAGEVHTFYTNIKTTDDHSYKRLFLRSNGGTTTDLIRMQNGRLTVAGEKMGRLEKGRWYQVMVRIDADSKKASLYIDGILKAGIYLTWDLSSISIRADVVGVGTEDAETTLYLDNTAYTKGNYPVSFDAPSAGEEVDETGKEQQPDTSVSGSTGFSFPEETLVMCLDNTGAYMGSKQITMGARPINKGGVIMLPVRAVAEQLGGAVEWVEETRTAYLTYANHTVELKDGEYPVVKGKTEADKAAMVGGVMYFALDTAADFFDKEVTFASSGAIVISAKGESVDKNAVASVIKKLAYSRPSAEQILQDFQSHSGGAHPRVLIDQERLEKIKGWVQNDEHFKKWYATLKRKADEILTEPVCTYELRDGVRLLYVSRDVETHVMAPALVYLIEGGEQYKDRVWKELSAVAAFPDWHPEHFLDTAEMVLPVAVGYDWLYDEWTPEQRKILQTAILRLGLDAAQSAYDGTAKYGTESGAQHNRMGWATDTSNWGLVCNGGIMTGALAVMGDAESEYCADIVAQALRSMEYPLSVFTPYGIYPEGTGYWEYATRYMSYAFSTLKYTTDSYYGYDMVPGLSATPYFPVYHTGPQGNFNYGDSGEGAAAIAVLFWFAEALNDPALNEIQLGRMEQYNQGGGYGGGSYAILFYNPELSEQGVELDRDYRFRSIETAMFANNQGSSGANYIGVKGGVSGGGHGDLDAGVFVLDAYGERWTVDYGTDDYNLPNYFFWPGRGDYYRKRAEGHSTLVINPDSGLDQRVGSNSPILDMQSAEGGAYALVDLTPAYANKATKANRLIALYDERSRFMIQDEVECPEKSDIWWLMQTKAGIEIAEDGKSAVLTIGDKHMLCLLQASDKNAVFTYTDAVPFATSPKGAGQTKNPGCYRLAVEAKGVKKLNLRVTFVPYVEGQMPDHTTLKLGSIEQLINSRVLDSDKEVYAKAESILVNGKALEHFNPQQFFYTLKLEAEDAEPQIAIESGYETKIEKTGDGKIVQMTVADPSGKLKDSVYSVYISRASVKPKYTKPDEGSPTKVVDVTASEIAEAENTPQNTIDGDAETKWSANGPQWIQYDLGSAKTLTGVGTLWMNNSSRRQKYSIDISADGKSWETIFSGSSRSSSKDMEYYNTEAENVRYVRLTVNGTSAGTWSSLLETEIYTK